VTGTLTEGRSSVSRQAITRIADAVTELGALALAFGQVGRATYLPDGLAPESDTDHTVMLSWAACALAEACAPGLDVGLVAQMAIVHDMPEVYAGDVDTLVAGPEQMAAKARREAAAIERLRGQFAGCLPWVTRAIDLYEAQEVPEARFVRALDKSMPKITHLLNGCVAIRERGMDAARLREFLDRQYADIAVYAGEFGGLMALTAELADREVALLTEAEAAEK